MSVIERGKSGILTLREILPKFPPNYPSKKMIEQIKNRYGQDRVEIELEAQALLTIIRQGNELTCKEKGQLHQLLTAGLGRPSTHAGAVFARLSSSQAAKRTKKG